VYFYRDETIPIRCYLEHAGTIFEDSLKEIKVTFLQKIELFLDTIKSKEKVMMSIKINVDEIYDKI
jgi:hypothetical protein